MITIWDTQLIYFGPSTRQAKDNPEGEVHSHRRVQHPFLAVAPIRSYRETNERRSSNVHAHKHHVSNKQTNKKEASNRLVCSLPLT